MADAGVKIEQATLDEVPYDDDEVALVAAATEPAVDDHNPGGELDQVLATGPGGKSEAQMNGVMVLSLLDKIIGVVDQIQQTQNGLEARQEAMEKSVSTIQGELAKLSKNHVGTTNTVNKMLEKVRKVSVNVKTVRSNLEKQAGQIKKLESNESELLKRRNFKVLIFQVRRDFGGEGAPPRFAHGAIIVFVNVRVKWFVNVGARHLKLNHRRMIPSSYHRGGLESHRSWGGSLQGKMGKK